MEACRGSAVGKEGWGASGSHGGKNGGAVCAEVEGEFVGEVWGGIGGGSEFECEAVPTRWRK